jgi:hypothetical protein
MMPLSNWLTEGGVSLMLEYRQCEKLGAYGGMADLKRSILMAFVRMDGRCWDD